jgi:hypothetical protein
VEHKAHTVYHQFLRRLVNQYRGGQYAQLPVGHGLAQPRVHRAGGVAGQAATVHVRGATGHGHAHHHVFAGGFFHEAHRGHHRHLARLGFFSRNDTQRAAEVVGMAVGEDDG